MAVEAAETNIQQESAEDIRVDKIAQKIFSAVNKGLRKEHVEEKGVKSQIAHLEGL